MVDVWPFFFSPFFFFLFFFLSFLFFLIIRVMFLFCLVWLGLGFCTYYSCNLSKIVWSGVHYNRYQQTLLIPQDLLLFSRTNASYQRKGKGTRLNFKATERVCKEIDLYSKILSLPFLSISFPQRGLNCRAHEEQIPRMLQCPPPPPPPPTPPPRFPYTLLGSKRTLRQL